MDEQSADLVEALDACAWRLRGTRRDLDEYQDYCTRRGLPADEQMIARLADSVRHAEVRIAEQRQVLLSSGAATAEELSGAEVVLRFGQATLSYTRGALEWCSASYDQTHMAQFFDLRQQDSPAVNYERYEHDSVRQVETQVLAVLGLSPETHAVSATSSGVAAYTLVEAFLIRERLRPGDTVLLAPYIYFEGSEQVTLLPFVRVERAAGYGVEEIVADALRHRPRVIFVDPLANTAQQRMIDVMELTARLRAVIDRPTTVVIDGTMVSGGLPPETLAHHDLVEVLYYESGSKYLQLGLDAGMAGMVAYPVALAEKFDRQRRNTGLILYRHGADLFPRYQRALYRRRMTRIGANAVRTAELLRADPRVSDVGQVFHPGLPDHPDRDIAARLPYAGGCVTFLFHERDRNTKQELNTLFDGVFTHTRQLGVQLTKGASFGFSVPRISPADAFDEDEPPFLRLYAGDRGNQVELLAEAIGQALAEHVGRVGRPPHRRAV
jgi:cystathionine gamma-synthase